MLNHFSRFTHWIALKCVCMQIVVNIYWLSGVVGLIKKETVFIDLISKRLWKKKDLTLFCKRSENLRSCQRWQGTCMWLNASWELLKRIFFFFFCFYVVGKTENQRGALANLISLPFFLFLAASRLTVAAARSHDALCLPGLWSVPRITRCRGRTLVSSLTLYWGQSSSHIKGSEGSYEESLAEPAEVFHAICAPPWGFIKKHLLHKFFEKVICDGRWPPWNEKKLSFISRQFVVKHAELKINPLWCHRERQ